MSKEPIILVDMDGVLVDVNPLLLGFVNERHGTSYTKDDLVAFGYDEYMEPEEVETIYERWHDADLYDGMPPIEGARGGVEELREIGRVVACSSPMVGHASSKLRWLRDFGFDRKDIVLATDKRLVGGDVLVDDGLHNLADFPGRCQVTFDQPWNQHYTVGTRVFSWPQVAPLVRDVLWFDGRQVAL